MGSTIINFLMTKALSIMNLFNSIFKKAHTCHILKWDKYVMAIPLPTNNCTITHQVFLSYPNNTRVNVTQPPGTQYKYLPSEFGALEYILVDAYGNEARINDTISVNCKIQRKKLME
jgi:hypothetical protein